MQIYLERYLQYTCENHIRNATYLLRSSISLRSVSMSSTLILDH